MSVHEYDKVKRMTDAIGRLGHIYGYLLGVPVINMFVQHRGCEGTNWYIRRPYFRNVPTYTKTGKSTKELYKRFSTELELYHHMFSQNTCTMGERERVIEGRIH